MKELPLNYDQIYNRSGIPVLIENDQGMIIHANPAACTLLGYNPDEIGSLKRNRLIAPGTTELDSLLKKRREKGSVKGELICLQKDGTEFPCEFTSNQFEDKNGNLFYTIFLIDISGHKQVRKRLHNVTDNVPGVVFQYLLYEDGRDALQYVSEGCNELWGVTPQEAMKNTDPIWARFHPSDVKDVVKSIQKSARELTEWSVEWRYLHPDGNTRWHRGSGNPTRLNNGVTIWDSIIIDVTREKTSETTLQKVMEQSLDVICIIDKKGRFVKVSDAAQQVWGYEPREIEGKPFLNLVHDKDRPKTQACADAIMEGEHVTDFENRYIRKDESIVPIFWSARWDFTEELIYAVARDATKIKHTEREVELREQRFKGLVREGSDLIAILDEEGHYLYASPNYVSYLGLNPDELTGKNAYDYIHPEDLDTLRSEIETAEPGKRVKTSPYRFRHKDGSWRWFETTVVDQSHDESIGGLVANSREITDSYYYSRMERLERGVLEQSAKGGSLEQTLSGYLDGLASIHPGIMSSVFECRGNQLYNVCSSGLPQDYTRQIEGMEIGESSGSCGMAGFYREKVLTEDTWTDPNWIDFRDLVKKHNLRSCWVHPVLDSSGELLATFAMYQNEPGLPGRWEEKSIRRIVHLIRVIMETHRKREELNRIFSFVPDVICVAGMSGYFKRVNPAMSQLLGYSEEELLTRPVIEFTHPDDRDVTQKKLEAIQRGEEEYPFLNRYITKSGEVVWFSWTATVVDKEQVIYAIARNVTTEKKLEELLEKTNKLARVGSWELDLRQREDKMFWSDMTREIMEVDDEYAPSLSGGFEFYVDESRERMERAVNELIQHGTPFDEEFEIRTMKGKYKWIRCIGDAEMAGGECVRLFGSFQDIDHRKHAEIAYKEAVEEQIDILESISDAFYAVSRDWEITYFNREAEKLLGVPVNEVIGQNLWECFPIMRETELYDRYSKVLNDKTPDTFEYLYPAQNSWYEISVYPANGGLSVYFKNINERKKAQARLEEKTEQLDAIAMFNGLLIKKENWLAALDESLAIFGNVLGTDRVYFFQAEYSSAHHDQAVTMNAEWVQDGISPQIDNPSHKELPVSVIWEQFNPLISNEICALNTRDIQSETFRELLEEQCVQSFLAVPVFTGSRFRGFIGFDDCQNEREWKIEQINFLQTITLNLASAMESEDAEKALQSAYQDRNDILESIGDGFFAVDKNWIVTYWNHMAEKTLGTRREDIVGENLWEYDENAVSLDFYKQYHRAMEEQVTVHFEEFYPETQMWIEVSAYPSESGLSVYFRDITLRKQSEQRLQDLNRQLKQHADELAASNSELEQFAFIASHDLQEPLRMITSFLRQLEKKYADKLDERGLKYIRFASDGARRLRGIIMDLLSFSRVGHKEISMKEVDLNDIMKNVKASLQKTHEDSRVEWSALPVVYGSEGLLRQVFQNLVSNGLKYQEGEELPRVTISCDETETHWNFSVTDNGIGIADDYQDKIFEIFQRLHTDDEIPGTGMGLAICKKIIEKHGGTIEVESEPDKGSTFRFTIQKSGPSHA
jgi:PAS domain S-box-containing protein